MASLLRASVLACIAATGITLAGCANDSSVGSMFSTGSLSSANDTTAALMPKNDPACGTLAAQIEALRKEGTIDRLEKSADGKGANVQVQRVALKKQSDLNKANAEFQAKCAPNVPKSAAVAPVAPAQAAAAVSAAKATPTAAQASAKAAIAPSGVTIAAPETPKVQ
jgi:hypothetical protein